MPARPARTDVEDAILDVLRAGLPALKQLGSLPLGLNDRAALNVQDSAVWVYYAGGEPGDNESLPGHLQQERWTFAVLCLAKRYRGAREGAGAACELLEAVIDILAGAVLSPDGTGDLPLSKGPDRLLPLPEGCGVVGYEILFTCDTIIQRLE
ncbi:hypothetical protein [Megalodesulfovibrio gigas]|uniref:Gp37 protein n=1 Tax=Megalodesulfovibrio gigas (strain ATCC 19364 / DSM 1382 / NCIMB 9332 / VKM B-1759) TaxID=1121448 RepID=T2G8C6_MEGG1|nr:hypothetical protein [Megalodesulfovibrio gigas]AGW12840.1 hypothetical protein DGI_0955 [Megalodesulfovibrio gigas DSM 1382 = ATCC 19364]